MEDVNATIADIMQSPVMTLTSHQSAAHAKELMRDKRVSALPLVDPDGELVGIVTASDLIDDHPDGAPVGSFAHKAVLSVHPGDQPHVAARIMRNHRLHHLPVVDNKRVVGIVSAFDLLTLVEDHRFVMKNAPTPPSKHSPARR